MAKFATNVLWRHLVVKFATNASGAMLFPNLVQVTESISGSVVPLAMFVFLFQTLRKLALSEPPLGFVRRIHHVQSKPPHLWDLADQ